MSADWEPAHHETCPTCLPRVLLEKKICGRDVSLRFRCPKCKWEGDRKKYMDAKYGDLLAAFETPEGREKLRSLPPTEFVGHDTLRCDAEIVGIAVRKEN